MAEAGSNSQLVRVFIPDVNAQKCIVLDVVGTVWTAKQVILDKIYQELTLNPLNYGLYVPSPGKGVPGKFMNDSHLLFDYTLEGKVPKLELRYKRRDFTQSPLTEKAIIKANSKANQKKLIENISSGTVSKIKKLLDAGLDPNFTTDDGNTPLGVACGRHSPTQCIMPLLAGGAHIDFRGKEGLTPMHRAAIGGNAQAISILLSFGASPNYRDAKGLTPLYHTAIMGDDTGACITLLRYRAEFGIQDQGGWTELHHTAKYGHTEHADLLIRFGADINAQNLVGNTPLHVAASHGQTHFALLLLKRGADKMKPNYAGQSPSQVSVLCGQHQLASEINTFTDDKIERITLPPDYNPNAKIENKLFDTRRVSEICPVRPSNEELADSLVNEWEQRPSMGVPTTMGAGQGMEFCGEPGYVTLEHPKMAAIRKNSNASLTSKESIVRVPDSGVGDTESISSLDNCSNHSGSTGTPIQGTPTMRRPSFLQQRERLYRAGPGRYVAIQDVESQQFGDLSLQRGMEVEVTFIGKGGYWEGRVNGKEGWFPRLAIKELGDEEFDYSTLSKTANKAGRMEKTPEVVPRAPDLVNSAMPQPTEPEEQEPPMPSRKEVLVTRGSRGYGFAMRGVRATKAMQFNPTPEVPALQYVGSVEQGGAADEAGLRTGDFIVEVNGYDTTHSTHDEVVDIVRKSGGTLRMKVMTPSIKPKSVSQQIKSRFTPVNTPDTEKKEERKKSDKTAKPPQFSKSHSPILTSTTKNILSGNSFIPEEKIDHETIIGDSPEDNRGPRVSPNLPRSGRFEWDSHGEESPSTSRKSSANGPAYQPMVTAYSTLPSHSTNSTFTSKGTGKAPSYPQSNSYFSTAPPKVLDSGGSARRGSPVTGQRKTSDDNSAKFKTLPSSLKHNPPRLSDYGDTESEEDSDAEDTSSFAAALRESRDRIKRNTSHVQQQQQQDQQAWLPQQRVRANTMPSPAATPPRVESPLLIKRSAATTEQDQDKMSPLQLEILKASQDRSNRISKQQSRLTEVSQKKESSGKEAGTAGERNSLAEVLSRRLDSMSSKMRHTSESDDDFESSPPQISTVKKERTKSTSSVGDRPSKAPPPTVKPKPDKRQRSESPARGRAASTSSVGGGETDNPITPTSPPSHEVVDELAPPSLPWEVKLRSSKKAEPKTKAAAKESSQLVDWKAALKPSNKTGRDSPLLSQRKAGSSSSVSEEATPPSTTTTTEAGFFLPPPLPENGSERFSFIDVAPPEAFMLEMDETSTDALMMADAPPLPPPSPSVLPPPPAITKEDHMSSQSPIPPPLPDTSPPPKVPSSANASVFIFPEASSSEKQIDDTAKSTPFRISVPDADNLPSPIPSPGPVQGDFGSRSTSISPLPPPADGFWVSDDLHESAFRQHPRTASLSLSETSEPPPPLPSEPPPTLPSEPPPPPPPSEPPPLLDSDTSDIFAHESTDISFGSHGEKPSSLSSSPGSEPQSYDVSAAEELVQAAKEKFVVTRDVDERKEAEIQSPSQPKVAPIVAKKPKRGFAIPPSSSPEPVPEPPQVQKKASPPAVQKKPSPTAATVTAVEQPVTETLPPPPPTKPTEKASEPPSPMDDEPSYKTTPLEEWSVSDVCAWLEAIGLNEHVQSFRENEMMGEHLVDISKEDLKELGLKKLGHQKTFLSKLNLIKK